MKSYAGKESDTEIRKKPTGPKPKLETLESIFFALKKSENALNMNPGISVPRKKLAESESDKGLR